MRLSVCIITLNEEANIARTLKSVQPLVADGAGEIIVVDSGSTDKTVEIAKSFGVKVFTEAWKGFPAQKNSSIEKAQGDWVLSLDADEEVTSELKKELESSLRADSPVDGFFLPRQNQFLGKWLKHGGAYPDPKLRLFRKGSAKSEMRAVHETFAFIDPDARSTYLRNGLIHYAYPTLSGYIEHMNRYSSLGAEVVSVKGQRGFSIINIVIRPWLTFIYNYFFRLGFLDGKQGLLFHLYHSVYVSWKYAKAWEMARKCEDGPQAS